MNRFVSIAISVVTLVANWFVFRWMGQVLNFDGGFFATVITLAILVHEVGHLIVLERNGIQTHLIFLVLFGGAVPAKKDRNKLSRLSWSTNAAISLAGVIANVALVAICAILALCHQLTLSELALFASINGSLILYNMIPFWIFDGGRFTKALFDSANEEQDGQYLWTISLIIFAVAIVLSIFTNHWFMNTSLWIFWGLMYKSKHDDPEGAFNRKAMTPAQQRRWIALYVALIISGMLLLLAGK